MLKTEENKVNGNHIGNFNTTIAHSSFIIKFCEVCSARALHPDLIPPTSIKTKCKTFEEQLNISIFRAFSFRENMRSEIFIRQQSAQSSCMIM